MITRSRTKREEREENTVPILPTDVYEYLANFADDRTILNMLSVNKKFNDEKFFKRVIQRKYPLLLRNRMKALNNCLSG